MMRTAVWALRKTLLVVGIFACNLFALTQGIWAGISAETVDPRRADVARQLADQDATTFLRWMALLLLARVLLGWWLDWDSKKAGATDGL